MFYRHTQYPKALYHPTKDAVLVLNAEAHAALGEGWKEEPFPKSDSPAEPAAPVLTAEEQAAAADARIAAELAAKAAQEAEAREKVEKDAMYAAPVDMLITKLAGAPRDVLERVHAYESANPNGPRKTLLAAVEKALKAAK